MIHKIIGNFSLLSLLIILPLYGQETKIVKVLDANLFEIQGGKQIRLANLICPSLTDTDSVQQTLARRIVKYARARILKRSLRYEPASLPSANVLAVYLFLKYPLQELFVNRRYLKEGFAVFDSLPPGKYNKLLQKSEQWAKKHHRGRWNPELKMRKVNRWHRFRLLAGGYLIPGTDGFVPAINLHYRWSDLLPLVRSQKDMLSFSAEAGAFWLIYFPYTDLGLEWNYKNFYVRSAAGFVYSGNRSENEKITLYPYMTINTGFRIFSKDGRSIDWQIGYLNFRTSESDDTLPLLFIGLGFSVF